MMEIERAPAGKIVDRLEERGWIERRPDSGDRRINRIFLTELGERVHAVIWPIAQSTLDDGLLDLSEAEVSQLTELLARVKMRLVWLAENDSTAEASLFDAIEARTPETALGDAPP